MVPVVAGGETVPRVAVVMGEVRVFERVTWIWVCGVGLWGRCMIGHSLGVRRGTVAMWAL